MRGVLSPSAYSLALLLFRKEISKLELMRLSVLGIMVFERRRHVLKDRSSYFWDEVTMEV